MQRFVVVAFREGEPDRHQELNGGSCIIGRTSDVDFVLPHTTISRRHAALCVAEGRVTIEDLASTNGVFLNGEQVKRSVVSEGDFLSVGDYTLVLRVLDDQPVDGSPEGRTLCMSAETARQRHAELLKRGGPPHAGVLHKATLLLGERMGLEPFLQEVVSLVMESFPARRGAVVLHRPDRNSPEVAASVCPNDDAEEVPVSRTLMEYVLRTDTALLTDNALMDPRFSTSQTVLRQRIGAAMCVPLFGSEETVGVFYVDTSEEGTRFSEQDLSFFTAMGHVVGLAVENRRFDERIAQQQRLAALGEAVAGISHDVRSVLTGLTAGTDLLERALAKMDPDRLTKACGIVRKSAERMESYMADLLAFVRNADVRRTLVVLHDLVRELVDTMAPQAARQRVELRFLGGGHEPVSIDPDQMQRVIENLVGNAIDACQDGGGAVTVSVGRQGDTHTIQVTDSGSGIAPENIRRLREPFFSTKGSGGTGLGLAICYRVVEQHGGRIHVSSQLGAGSVFTVLVPDAPVDEVQVQTRNTQRIETTEAASVELAFKTCPGCGVAWLSQERFLKDPAVALAGYQVRFEDLSGGLFQFAHTCGTTLAVPVSDFRHLYGGKTFDEPLTGTEACPGYCKSEDELRPCPAECMCARIREVLQVVRGWPKGPVQSGAPTEEWV
ncbi:MAG: FHA domain-containing protein [bacterium]|nr:FHA domain-containing protein [bacterium]